MNFSRKDPMVRMLKLAMRLARGGDVTHKFITDTFDVSLATAKRDLVVIERALPLQTSWSPRAEGGVIKTVRLMEGA